MKIQLPPPMHPNRIHAAYMDMLNKGQFYVPQLGGPPISIYEWKVREVERWNRHSELFADGQTARET